MAFAQRLQEVRRRSGLTQEQFAERLCVSRQAVSKWESGRGYPEIEKILYICSCYGVTLNELFDQELPPPSESSAPEPEPAPLPTESLHRSLAAFFNNLAPRNKWLAAGILAGVAALAGLIGLCLKGGSSDMATVIWIGAMVLFGVVEAATAGLTSIWFVLGSVAGLIAAICDGPVWLQLTLFFVVSIISLAATRPLVKKLMGKNIVATNADRVLGAQARDRGHRQHPPHRGRLCRRQDVDRAQRVRRADPRGHHRAHRAHGGREALCSAAAGGRPYRN